MGICIRSARLSFRRLSMIHLKTSFVFLLVFSFQLTAPSHARAQDSDDASARKAVNDTTGGLHTGNNGDIAKSQSPAGQTADAPPAAAVIPTDQNGAINQQSLKTVESTTKDPTYLWVMLAGVATLAAIGFAIKNSRQSKDRN
jgi:hypothetical protein